MPKWKWGGRRRRGEAPTGVVRCALFCSEPLGRNI
uniref:Uncharacterized protein n=1 Tax=Arundo donax TaxID=35708 RepID=A0A0A9ATX3_ARUDO